MATNVAASANGGTATASTTLSAGYAATCANNGDRTGANYGTTGAWVDNTPSSFDDWIQIDFNASYSINQIDLFGVQDNYLSPTTPTLSMTSALYGLKDFEIQYWTGSAWSTISGGNVTGNNHVWTEFTFTAIATTKIRVLIHQSQDPYSRVVELEAWTAPSVPATPNTPSPADTATGISLTPTLTWVASGATSYNVYFGTAGSPPLVNSGQAAASYAPAGLVASTSYHWKIVAINSSGSTTGPIWTFTTGAFGTTTSIKPTKIIEAELAGAGNGWTDVTADVRSGYGIEIRYGIQGSGGTARLVLDNSTSNSAGLIGYYSPYHANKRTGWGLGIGFRIRFQDPNTGSYYTRFTGRVDAIDPVPGIKRERAVAVTVTDWLDEAARWAIPPTIGEQISLRGDEILTNILALMPRQPVATSFDSGTETYTIALDTSPTNAQPALAEFGKLAASEFGPIYVKADGTLRYESRHTRLLNTTVVWTIPESAMQDLRLPSTRDEVINVVRVTNHARTIDPNPTTLVYDQANVIAIGAGQTMFLGGSFRDPITGDPIGARDVQTQIQGTDYVANTMEDGSGTDISSSLTWTANIGPSGATWNIVNTNAATAYLLTNVLYGRAVYDRGALDFEARDSASVALLGELTATLDMPYQDNNDVASGAATYILNRYSSAFAQARRIQVDATTTTLLAQVLVRDISDRITPSETVTGLNNSFFINGETLRVWPSGHVSAEYVLAPAADPTAGLYWILGTSTLGTDTIPAPF